MRVDLRRVPIALALAAGCRAARAPYVPRDAALRALPLYFYPSADTTRPARALVFFFGNDIGFWEAHQRLAERLAGDGFDVVGFDVKRFLATLPEPPARRDSAFGAAIVPIIERARHELHAEALPLVIGGHSIGAEIAIWTAAYARPPGTVGILAMGPGLRSHLHISAEDILSKREPSEPGSFAVADALRAVPADARVALVRGQHDEYAYADSALAAAGGARLRRYVVPLAGHSLKRLSIAGPVIGRALDWLVERNTENAEEGQR
jgi:type IV secretory pathway VirJ component